MLVRLGTACGAVEHWTFGALRLAAQQQLITVYCVWAVRNPRNPSLILHQKPSEQHKLLVQLRTGLGAHSLGIGLQCIQRFAPGT